MRMWLLAAPLLLPALACIDPDMAQQAIDAVQMEVGRPEEFPQIRNEADAFRYPPELFGQQVQGNVTLRVYVDSTGLAVPDSTHVVESSGHAGLDSAAVIGTLRVTFEPAKLRGRPTGMSILLPVYFRHPEAAPLPGDTVLNRRP